MQRVIAYSLHRTASVPANFTLTDTENNIFQFIRAACDDIGQQAGKQPTARVAGGWVRDRLLNVQSKDIDITVDMKGDEFAQWLYQIAQNRYGPSQKVVTFPKTTEERPEQIKNLSVAFLRMFGQDVEILPLRGNEVYEEGSRNPVSTEEATAELDAFRRDLTINSMFYNINTGQIEDFTGQGFNDLQTMTLRTPTRPGKDPAQEATRIFSEDPLRLLRILRFNGRYEGSQISPEVLEAMKNPNIHHQIVRRLQGDASGGIVPERTADELKKIMMGDQPEKALRTMYDIGLLKKILLLPEGYGPLEMNQMNKHHELTVIEHTLQVLKNANKMAQEFGLTDTERMGMNFTALFHDLGKLDVRSHKYKDEGSSRGYSGDPNNPEAITHQQASQERWLNFARMLKLSDEDKSTISEAVLSHMNPHGHIEDVREVSDRELRRYRRKNPAWLFQYIHAMADAMSKSETPQEGIGDPYRANIERIQNLPYPKDMSPSDDLLKGGVLMQLVGLPPRPPPGLDGYIEVLKGLIKEEQDNNYQLSPQDATAMVTNWTAQGQAGTGPLAPYFQNNS